MSRRALPDWNAVRYDPTRPSGHVESYFVKANSPDGNQALWIKATIFASRARPMQAVAEAWAVYFERDGQHVAVKQSIPFASAVFSTEGLHAEIGEFMRLDPERAHGAIGYGDHKIDFDLKMSGDEPPIVMFPNNAMYTGPFPRSKLVTPRPDLVLEGTVKVDEREINVTGWRGMQGHNWGKGHADFYAWGHCNLWEQGEGLVVEATTARVKVGPMTTPLVTLVSVRHRGVCYDFNSPVQMMRNRGEVDGRRWHFEAHAGDVRVEADVCGQAPDFVGLYYPNPDGQMTWCLNTKLATARVRLEVAGRGPMDWKTKAAAFEIGTREPDHGIRMYV